MFAASDLYICISVLSYCTAHVLNESCGFKCSGNVSFQATWPRSYVSGGILAGKLEFSIVTK